MGRTTQIVSMLKLQMLAKRKRLQRIMVMGAMYMLTEIRGHHQSQQCHGLQSDPSPGFTKKY